VHLSPYSPRERTRLSSRNNVKVKRSACPSPPTTIRRCFLIEKISQFSKAHAGYAYPALVACAACAPPPAAVTGNDRPVTSSLERA